MGKQPANWHRLVYKSREHHRRFVRRVSRHKLVCQECRGSGKEIGCTSDQDGGPWSECVWCEGTGYVTPHLRGVWLRHKRAVKAGL